VRRRALYRIRRRQKLEKGGRGAAYRTAIRGLGAVMDIAANDAPPTFHERFASSG
jgi:hypothetical protein